MEASGFLPELERTLGEQAGGLCIKVADERRWVCCDLPINGCRQRKRQVWQKEERRKKE